MSRNPIYDLFDTAFRYHSASAIFKDGKHVANLCFKFPRKGAGRLWCYLHVLSLPMVRGYASGYGYDKKSTAFCAAANKAASAKLESWQSKADYEAQQAIASGLAALSIAARLVDEDWRDALRGAGYTVVTVC